MEMSVRTHYDHHLNVSKQSTRQGANTLNRSMQNIWSAHRRGKVNLNSPRPTSPNVSTPNIEESIGTLPTPGLDLSTEGDATAAGVPLDEPGTGTTPITDGRSVKRKVRTRTNTAEEGSKRPKLSTASKEYAPPTARLSDLGGVSDAVEKMLELVAMPLCHPEIYLHTGVQPPRGVLLHGPPGCGKTLLANAIAGVSELSCLS